MENLNYIFQFYETRCLSKKLECIDQLYSSYLGLYRISYFCPSNTDSEESKRIMTCSYARAVTVAPFFSSAKLIAFLTFMVYILQGHELRARQVFVALALFNPVRLTLTLFVPFAVQMMSESCVTIDRVQV